MWIGVLWAGLRCLGGGSVVVGDGFWGWAVAERQCQYPIQKYSRRLLRSRRRKSRSIPEGGADFPATIFLAGSAQTLAGIAFRAAGKSGRNFPVAPKFAGKSFQQGISNSHSFLEFSDL